MIDKEKFNDWWDNDLETHITNDFSPASIVWYAYEGWARGAEAEREACARLIDDLVAERVPASTYSHAIRARKSGT